MRNITTKSAKKNTVVILDARLSRRRAGKTETSVSTKSSTNLACSAAAVSTCLRLNRYQAIKGATFNRSYILRLNGRNSVDSSVFMDHPCSHCIIIVDPEVATA